MGVGRGQKIENYLKLWLNAAVQNSAGGSCPPWEPVCNAGGLLTWRRGKASRKGSSKPKRSRGRGPQVRQGKNLMNVSGEGP